MIRYNYFIDNQNILVRWAYFIPDVDDKVQIKKVILYLNGRGEWIEKNFFDLIQNINISNDCALVSLDYPGQGASQGTRADIKSYDEYALSVKNILEAFCKKFNLNIKNLEYCLIAHSMGGLIALYSIMSAQISVPKVIILSSPFLGICFKFVPTFLVNMLSALMCFFNPTIRVPRCFLKEKTFENNDLTGSLEYYNKILMSPFPIGRPTYRWIKVSFQAIKYVFSKNNIKKIKTFTCLMVAEKETVVSKRLIMKWFNFLQKYSTTQPSLICIKNAKHELLCEIDSIKRKVYCIINENLAQFLHYS